MAQIKTSHNSEVAQDKRTLNVATMSLQEARLTLGKQTKFLQLARLIDQAIDEAQGQIVGADDFLHGNT